MPSQLQHSFSKRSMATKQSKIYRIGVLMDEINGLNIKKDTSLALIEAAQEKGCEVYYLQQQDLRLEVSLVRARVAKLDIDLAKTPWYVLGEWQDIDVSDLDVVLMR